MSYIHPKTRRNLIIAVTTLAVLGVSAGIVYFSWTYAGPIDTIVYVVLFAIGVTMIPGTVLLGAPSFPDSLRSIFGKLHFILGQVSFNGTYLVQREDKWELCPGDKDRVYIDCEWHEIDSGKENISVLGWKPFGLILEKTDSTLSAARVDPKNLALTRTDGGDNVVRAGYQQKAPPVEISGDNNWIVDLKRLYSRGLQKIGDIDVIEKAEEIMMRENAKGSKLDEWGAIIGSAIGLIIGVMTGYALLGGV